MVINAYEEGEGTIEAEAEEFGVGTAFIAAAPRRGALGTGAQAKLEGTAREKLRAAVVSRLDATLGKLKAKLRSACKVEVSTPIVC